MNHLLLVPLNDAVPAAFLDSFRQAGWRISVTSDTIRAKQLVQTGEVDGVVIEVNPGGDSVSRLRVLRSLHEARPEALVVMLNSGAGALGENGQHLTRALNYMEDARVESRTRAVELYRLSPAQKRIADLVAQAYPNREIARRLRIKEQSVRNELSRIFKKMGVWNRVELALLMRTGLPDKPPVEKDVATQENWPKGLASPIVERKPDPPPLLT